VIENFIGTKSYTKILEGLKQKVDIFIGIKNIFNPIIKLIFKKNIIKLFLSRHALFSLLFCHISNKEYFLSNIKSSLFLFSHLSK